MWQTSRGMFLHTFSKVRVRIMARVRVRVRVGVRIRLRQYKANVPRNVLAHVFKG